MEALYDREAARRVIFRNLLERQGYASLEDVRAEGEIEGLRKAVVEVLRGRGLAVEDDLRTALANSADPATLGALLRQAGHHHFGCRDPRRPPGVRRLPGSEPRLAAG